MKNLVKCIKDTVNAIIFDLDGLLVDTEIISYQIYKEMLEPFGYSFTKEEYAQGYSGKTGIVNMTNIISKYQLPYSIDEGMKIEEDIENRLLANGVALKKGAKELLVYLKENHYKIGLATSSTKNRAMLILQQHNIENYFDAFTFGFEVEKGKPNPDIFLKTAEKLNEGIKIARENDVKTIQRFFVVDSRAIGTAVEMIESAKPDMIEIMPGVAYKAIKEFSECIKTPVIAGGLIETDKEVEMAIASGAVAVSTGNQSLWR